MKNKRYKSVDELVEKCCSKVVKKKYKELMKLDNIENTPWAKKFYKINPIDYNQGIDLARNPNLDLFLYHNKETDNWLWSISTEDNFWMDSFKTKKEALALCKKMGWKLSKTIKEKFMKIKNIQVMSEYNALLQLEISARELNIKELILPLLMIKKARKYNKK